MSAAPVSQAVAAHAIAPRASGRPWTFYVLLTVFILYVRALYGPMICIYILSFQDVRGGLVFPMRDYRCIGSSTCSPRCAPAT
jgi:putative spermidine/putrescine transport system permease protein